MAITMGEFVRGYLEDKTKVDGLAASVSDYSVGRLVRLGRMAVKPINAS